MKLILIFFFIILTSCSNSEEITFYKYNNITITRFDNGNMIKLYYGLVKGSDSISKPHIKATYYGRDGSMDAYLIIGKDGNVQIVPMGDFFEEKGFDQRLKLKEFNNNVDFVNWDTRIKNKFDNVIYISSNKNIEIKRNSENNSNVKAIYQ